MPPAAEAIFIVSFWVKQTAADAINNSLINISVRAFPNPFINTITLQLPGTLCTVKITNMAGRVLFTQTTSAAILQTGAQLKAGIYGASVAGKGNDVLCNGCKTITNKKAGEP